MSKISAENIAGGGEKQERSLKLNRNDGLQSAVAFVLALLRRGCILLVSLDDLFKAGWLQSEGLLPPSLSLQVKIVTAALGATEPHPKKKQNAKTAKFARRPPGVFFAPVANHLPALR